MSEEDQVTAEKSPVIFVPGIGGSVLKDRRVVVWGTGKMLLLDFEALTLPGTPLTAAKVLKEVILLRPLAHGVYGKFIKYMRERLGYTEDEDLFLFPYDWRQDCRTSAKKLRLFIRDKRLMMNQNAKVTVVAHSMGGLVARYCAQMTGMEEHISRVVTVGTPHHGSPEALQALLLGSKIFPAGFRQRDTIPALRTFPSSYQLLPGMGRYIEDEDGNSVDLFDSANQNWLSEESHLDLLNQAAAFRRELNSMPNKVPVYSIFGYGQRTLTKIVVPRQNTVCKWDRVRYHTKYGGDGTVPEDSAILHSDYQIPVNQRHMSLLDDRGTHRFLKTILSAQNNAPRRSSHARATAHTLIVEVVDSVYSRGSVATIKVGLIDPQGKIVRGTKFHIDVYRDNNRGESVAIVHRLELHESGTLTQGQLTEGRFPVPSSVGEYHVRASLIEPRSVNPSPQIDYFAVRV